MSLAPEDPLRDVRLLLLDVNETLSDMRPLARRLLDVGLPEHVLRSWFGGVLRDGFAITAAGGMVTFREVAADNLAGELRAVGRDPSTTEDAVAHVLSGFAALDVHPDVGPGLRGLADGGLRLVPLTNGASAMSEAMFTRAGVLELFERRLSVEDVGRWKPAPEPYRYAVHECGVGAHEAALVAAHPWDIQGAQRAGLRGIWVDRDGEPYPGYLPDPDLVVPDLTSLAQLLVE